MKTTPDTIQAGNHTLTVASDTIEERHTIGKDLDGNLIDEHTRDVETHRQEIAFTVPVTKTIDVSEIEIVTFSGWLIRDGRSFSAQVVADYKKARGEVGASWRTSWLDVITAFSVTYTKTKK